jgi:hypothetical protein
MHFSVSFSPLPSVEARRKETGICGRRRSRRIEPNNRNRTSICHDKWVTVAWPEKARTDRDKELRLALLALLVEEEELGWRVWLVVQKGVELLLAVTKRFLDGRGIKAKALDDLLSHPLLALGKHE